jgi:hypothetical protein
MVVSFVARHRKVFVVLLLDRVTLSTIAFLLAHSLVFQLRYTSGELGLVANF